MRKLCGLLLVLWLLALQLPAAPGSIELIKTEIRATIMADHLALSYALINPTGKVWLGRLTAELLAPDDSPKAASTTELELPGGRSQGKLQLPFHLAAEPHLEKKNLPWLRVRLTLRNQAGATILTHSFSLSEITANLFTISVAAQRETSPAQPYYVRVQAQHPIKQTNVSGVQLTAWLMVAEKVIARQSGLTNLEGGLILSFPEISAPAGTEAVTLKVAASKDGINDQYETEVELAERAYVYLSNDKPIYQPGQSFRTRLLAVYWPRQRALANTSGELEFENPEGETVYRARFTTNEYGVASVAWTLPPDLRLGEYTITAELDDFDDSSSHGSFKVSRYELPTFEVTAESDRKFYLPGHSATVTVSAQYLFGQPVTKGKVRVVREAERHWDYKKQKWQIKEEATYEGETDERGRFITRIKFDEVLDDDVAWSSRDLRADWQLPQQKYRDLNFAAYFTDASTGRTEQRRFDLRVSHEPIHVYLFEKESSVHLAPEFFIATYTAAGEPVATEVRLLEYDGRFRETIKTNRRGLAKYTSLWPLKTNDDLIVKAIATDEAGRQGQVVEQFYVNYEGIRLTTQRTIYRPGRPIQVNLRATWPEATLLIDVVANHRLVRSFPIKLKNHQASFVVPYAPAFKGLVTIAAYRRPGSSHMLIRTSRAVLYPNDQSLALKVALARPEYQPGALVAANFTVTDAKGAPLESALGVNVIDSALEVRARTDAEFGGGSAANYFAQVFQTGQEQIGGITLSDLQRLDLARPILPEHELAAEALLQRSYYYPWFAESEGSELNYNRNFPVLFAPWFTAQRDRLKELFADFQQRHNRYPSNPPEVYGALRAVGLTVDSLRDPWENPYRLWTGVQRTLEGFSLYSNGPDQLPNTEDDLLLLNLASPYFTQTSDRITEILNNYHQRSGAYVRDEPTFRTVLRAAGFNPDALRDKWDSPYRFAFRTDGRYHVCDILSSGPDRLPGTYDDFAVTHIKQDYFAPVETKLRQAIYDNYSRTQQFPRNEAEFVNVLQQTGIDFAALKDPWNNPYYASFSQWSRYEDRTTIEAGASKRLKVEPVTRTYYSIVIHSRGADGKQDQWKDLRLGIINQLAAEEERGKPEAQAVKNYLAEQSGQTENNLPRLPPGSGGAIRGTVTDAQGAVLLAAKVILTSQEIGATRTEQADEQGQYNIESLPAGYYSLRVEAAGFKHVEVRDIYVSVGVAVTINVTLDVGSVSETVTVSAGVAELNQTSATGVMKSESRAAASNRPAIHPPRLRQYFPENLFWQPMLVTDAQGRARVEFKLADTITSWKLAVIGSTKDGRIGVAETRIRSFQPFFIEPDPPKVLTEGDEISLPVVIRNYTERKQDVKLSITPASWFKLLNQAEKQVLTPAGQAVTNHFRLRALTAGEQKNTITGLGREASDAVEKPILVQPDGQEQAQTIGELLNRETSLEVTIPEDALPHGRQTVLKLYPNLFAQALEGIEGIVQRPGGCGEQTISSAYPNLLVLQYLKRTGKTLPQVEATAQRNLQLGYDRLTSFITADGGVAYFIGNNANFALTAYALRFMSEAQEFLTLDAALLKRMQDWLLKQQDTSGRWVPESARYYKQYEDGAPQTTAYILSVLTQSGLKDHYALTKAFTYLARVNRELPDPYTLALYTLAQLNVGQIDQAQAAAQQLEQMSRTEGSKRYWHLEVNTPFYGWGRAGRVETTALALEALVRTRRIAQQQTSNNSNTINQALLFLLREKDRYGVWYSSQATVLVLRTLIALSDEQTNAPAAEVEVLVNGRAARRVTLPAGAELTNPTNLDLSEFMSGGRNVIELRRSADGSATALQLVESHYVPWSRAENLGQSDDLQLTVALDKAEAGPGQTITYSITAERVAFRGYGMLLAEIGLLPGVEVDRASLERAVAESGWGVRRYDVLPDRIVFYLWPQAGGTKLRFTVKPRFPVLAKLAPSVVYDYYNPEARVWVEPQLIKVQ